MKRSKAQELLKKIEAQIAEAKEKRRALRMDFELNLLQRSHEIGDPNAPFRQQDRLIAQLEARREQLLLALERAGMMTEDDTDEDEQAESSTGSEETGKPAPKTKG